MLGRWLSLMKFQTEALPENLHRLTGDVVVVMQQQMGEITEDKPKGSFQYSLEPGRHQKIIRPLGGVCQVVLIAAQFARLDEKAVGLRLTACLTPRRALG
jgi:hypothetical protein